MKEIREIRETWRVCEIGEDFSEGGKRKGKKERKRKAKKER